MIQAVFFVIFAFACVASALSLILQKNPVYNALSLIVVIASTAGLFLLLNATFLAVLQIVVYAGAIMALFLFVVMMMEAGDELPAVVPFRTTPVLVVLLLIAGGVIWAINSAVPGIQESASPFDMHELSRQLFTSYVFPFEAITILIISSVIGALYIARKES